LERNALQTMAEDIANGLVLEMGNPRSVGVPAPPSIVDLLVQQLAIKVAALINEADSSQDVPDESLEARLQKAERKLAKLAVDGLEGDEDEIAGSDSSFPNLKYARPKYKNVESILKYAERQDDSGGVKLVIMNFND